MRRAAPLLALGLLPLLAPGCRGASPTPTGARVAAAGPVTPAFQGMSSLLANGAALRSAGDAAGLRRQAPAITQHALGLLSTGYPHDLRDADVAHFREGREAFGQRLKTWVRAAEASDDGALFQAFDALAEAYWAWVDAYKGLPPERSV